MTSTSNSIHFVWNSALPALNRVFTALKKAPFTIPELSLPDQEGEQTFDFRLYAVDLRKDLPPSRGAKYPLSVTRNDASKDKGTVTIADSSRAFKTSFINFQDFCKDHPDLKDDVHYILGMNPLNRLEDIKHLFP